MGIVMNFCQFYVLALIKEGFAATAIFREHKYYSRDTAYIGCGGTSERIEVISASWFSGVNSRDVTNYVRVSCEDMPQICLIIYGIAVMGDPAPRRKKQLKVEWKCTTKNRKNVYENNKGFSDTSGSYLNGFVEHKYYSRDTAEIECESRSEEISVIYASWFHGSHGSNVTNHMRTYCNNQPMCTFDYGIDVMGDPDRGKTKELLVEWTCTRGIKRTRKNLRKKLSFSYDTTSKIQD